MRDLARPETVRQAALAALFTTALCLPRFWLWDSRPTHPFALAFVLATCSLVLWGFVFAWSPQALRPIFHLHRHPGAWATSTLGGIACALLLTLWVDPSLRPLYPEQYATTLHGWLAGLLFALALGQLFLCFAPICFFHRLWHRALPAAIATALFGVFLLGLQLQAAPSLEFRFVLSVVVIRAGLGLFAAFLFLRGGPWTVWWWAALLEARLLPGLLARAD